MERVGCVSQKTKAHGASLFFFLLIMYLQIFSILNLFSVGFEMYFECVSTFRGAIGVGGYDGLIGVGGFFGI